MKISILVFVALFGIIGSALAMYGGGYTYVPVQPGYGGGYNDTTFMMLIGFLFLILILFQSGLFNTTTTNSTSPTGVTVISG